MKQLPRILIIDDDYGHMRGGKNPIRDDFCYPRRLRDITGDRPLKEVEEVPEPIAEVYFTSGQKVENGELKNDLEGTIEVVKNGWLKWPRWSLILLDLRFITGRLNEDGQPKGGKFDDNPEEYFGLKIFEQIANDSILCDIPVIILSSMDRADVEKKFSDCGARHFVDKNALNIETIKDSLHTIGLLEDDVIIGRSVPLLKCLREARKRAEFGNDNILVFGETGTGKELLAKYLHKNSPYKNNNFIKLNTQGVPETLIEDKLFGHNKGAYNGAISTEAGAAELANKSTLFIDEFGDVPSHVQSKLIDLLDKNTRTIQRLGSNENKKLNLQIVMATNRIDIINSGDFRADILSRAKVSKPIILPPLRERTEDIPILANYFLRKYETSIPGAEKRVIDKEAMDVLMKYDWPDNIRGLENVIEQAVSDYKGLRILTKNHIRLGIKTPTISDALDVTDSKPQKKLTPKSEIATVDELIALINEFEFDHTTPEQWQWKGEKLREAFIHLMERYLRAGLDATRKISFEIPDGEIQHTPAINFILGPKRGKGGKYSSTEAYAQILRMLLPPCTKNDIKPMITDPVVKEIYPKAEENRSTPKKSPFKKRTKK